MAEANAPDLTPGSPDHAAAMALKFQENGGTAAPDGTPEGTPEGADEQRPAWLDEKFKTPEDLAKAYKALEAKLGAKPEPAKPEPAKADPAKPESGIKVPEGIDVDAMSQEVADNGDLSEASKAILRAKGYSDGEIKMVVDGQKALAEQAVNKLYSVVGGEENFAPMAEWAKANFTAAEQAAYHAALEKDLDTASLALQNLAMRYQQATGTVGRMTQGDPTRNNTAGFSSAHEMTKAINDPRYSRDASYRRQVEARIVASTFQT